MNSIFIVTQGFVKTTNDISFQMVKPFENKHLFCMLHDRELLLYKERF